MDCAVYGRVVDVECRLGGSFFVFIIRITAFAQVRIHVAAETKRCSASSSQHAIYSVPSNMPIIPHAELTMGERKGSGSFSEVWSALWTRSIAVGRHQMSQTPVAVKMSLRVEHSEDVLDELARELAVVSSLPHQNILTVYGVCFDEEEYDHEKKPGRLRIVYELMDTDLSQLLKSNKGRLKYQTKLLLRVLRDVAAGLVHLHAHGVLHRDVKPANVLLKGDERETVRFRVEQGLETERAAHEQDWRPSLHGA